MNREEIMDTDRNILQELPAFIYEGEIVLVDAPKAVETAVEELKNHVVLGFDTETKPSFKKGEFHDVSLLQLASTDRVYLFRLNKCGFPSSLRALLADKRIKKIGVGIRDDIKSLNRLGKFKAETFIELQSLAEVYGIEVKSFMKLMAVIFHVRISKGQQTSNWEKEELTDAQMRYAATDAWGALKMYLELTGNWVKIMD